MSRRKKGRSALDKQKPSGRYPAPEPDPPRPNTPFMMAALALLVGWWVYLLVLAFGGQ